MAFVITSPCEHEKAAECADVCPVDCIEEGENMYYINPDLCIDCGACEAVCPVEAIYIEDEIPEDQQHYIELNKKFFESRD
ncbi:indolepyruvate ferredoxin oxidoreductase subunit alpha [Heyndrickxia ginsengihumi]|uniref:Ferredoxin n=1 Tax=Heyndrickxia ginsengihumi TaxID=363870 RepID=A0A0A6VGP0_9BACI|nr:4Fe-4S binding protein [Heyndrickxia ginsengihumi]KHD86613.1 4Fe-4S ferredoxin [Heyndrickxia ginsengihumi]MBE6185275.1 4Fe-4S dicluster domain-containing protein [Bacillus sp. (in: firmicutes)]MCM3022649.1 4Fe-4S binding protein [Heyndrickxia ginsengihumi]NEY19012.1 4Fe-4S dicluster domain-containing protein [Heyndrickxia ginsengihumi]